MKQQLFVSPRNIVIHSTLGHSLGFKKGEPTYVPRIMYEEVMEKGIMPCNEKGEALDSDTPEVEAMTPEPVRIVIKPTDAFERDDKILNIMRQIVEVNNPDDFTAAGMPSAKKISSTLGWAVDTKDVRTLWMKHAGELKGQKEE